MHFLYLGNGVHTHEAPVTNLSWVNLNLNHIVWLDKFAGYSALVDISPTHKPLLETIIPC